MNISPDYLIERKRNKSQLAKWKISSLILVLVIVFITGNKMIGGKNTSFLPKDTRGEYIANILLEEIIYDDLSRVKKLEKIAEDKNIKAVISEDRYRPQPADASDEAKPLYRCHIDDAQPEQSQATTGTTLTTEYKSGN